MTELILRPYQEVGRDFLASRTRALLADEMRVGKTPQAILAAEKIGAERILVVCPAIAVPQWRREFGRWWRRSSPPTSATVVSYDRARIIQDELKAQDWDVLIVDEAHFAQNLTAQRTKMIYGKGGLGYSAHHIWPLSGTFPSRHAGQTWPMARAFRATDMPYDAFVQEFCTGYYDRGQFRATGTKIDKAPILRKMLAPFTLRRTRAEVAPDMKPIEFQTLSVEPKIVPADLHLPPGMSDDDLLLWLEAHSAVDKANRQAVAQAKVAPLVEELEFALNNGLLKQTVVFGWHRQPLLDLCAALQERGIPSVVITGDTSSANREIGQWAFNSGQVKVCIANILAAGTAIDLSAASHGYFLELDWVPGNNVQAANRLVSMDKKEPVTFDVVTWAGSTDDRVQSVLTRRVRELSLLM